MSDSQRDQEEDGGKIPSPALSSASACIACGATFSEGGTAAVAVAAGFAKALHEPLLLINVDHSTARQRLPADLNESLRRFLQDQFKETAEQLRSDGIPILPAFQAGDPATSLLTETAEHGARLLVFGISPNDEASRELSLQVVKEIRTPMIVVRRREPFEKWLAGERELRVLIGIDFSPGSWVALRWVKWLRTLAPCDVTVAVLEPEVVPPEGADVCCKAEANTLARKTTQAREHFFRQLVEEVLGQPRPRLRFESAFAHSDAHVIATGAAARTDLIVLGRGPSIASSNYRPIWPGVLRYGPFNIALVPRDVEQSGDPSSFPIVQQKSF